MSETNEVGRTHTSFHYPVVKHPTGRVQFRKDGAEVVTIDRIGDVHRAQVVTIMPAGKEPTAKALDFARGLVVTGNFSHVAADTPLGQPDEFKPKKAAAEQPTNQPPADTTPQSEADEALRRVEAANESGQTPDEGDMNTLLAEASGLERARETNRKPKL